eukprot:COSAG01_NODE_12056_length_1807_cov_1.225410_2_plen_210_part_00
MRVTPRCVCVRACVCCAGGGAREAGAQGGEGGGAAAQAAHPHGQVQGSVLVQGRFGITASPLRSFSAKEGGARCVDSRSHRHNHRDPPPLLSTPIGTHTGSTAALHHAAPPGYTVGGVCTCVWPCTPIQNTDAFTRFCQPREPAIRSNDTCTPGHPAASLGAWQSSMDHQRHGAPALPMQSLAASAAIWNTARALKYRVPHSCRRWLIF